MVAAKKLWEIVVKDTESPEIRRKLRRILKPVDGVGNSNPCDLCGEKTTWTVNSRPVCPRCCGRYGFVPQDRLPDPCEVCGKQGEWCTQGDPVHSLCFRHREDWFRWKRPELEFIDSKKEPEKWEKAWNKGWAEFVAFMKENPGSR
jgi:hypothetical protein